MAGKKEKTLEEAFAELDEMLVKLADREVSLEESFEIYAEGTKLLKYCSDKLDRVEKKMLVMNEEGGLDEF
ncbi:exodeoxyribonuclease VII small subunit [Lachnoclostridium sp. An131]|uniref:exodeoxyribonuclease VII small subunit n=1 Tax=Lachnoclostridium sp. An131 TaxID=1965555 RepID=UPI000B38F084|nr:exodeoxyribonuclease VII small subunit [Lachnoclostridium sp. An131]OUQ27354.1 exodeoxyribonuclease VII small subunit [Lachnoclostridium sp. An131]